MSALGTLAPRLLRTSGLLILARLVAAGLTFLFQALLARWLGADGLGVYVLATSLAAILAIFGTLGFGAVTPRFVAAYRAGERPDLIAGFRKSGRRHLLAASGVLVAFAAAAPFVPGLLSPGTAQPLFLAALAAPLLGLIRLNGAFANVSRRFLLGFLPDILMRPALHLVLLGGLAAFTAVKTPEAAIGVFLLAAALAALTQAALVRRRVPDPAAPPAYETNVWRRAALPMILAVLLTTYLTELDLLLLAPLLGAAEVAVFSVCLRLIAFVGFALYAVQQVTLPDLSEAWARGDRATVRTAIGRANRLSLLAAAGGLVGSLAVGNPILAVFGPDFVAGYPALVLVAGVQLVLAALGPAAQLLTVAGEQNRVVAAFGAGLVVTALLNLALVSRFGVEGAALALAAGQFVSAVMLWAFARARLGIDTSLIAGLTRVSERPASSYIPLSVGPVAQQDRASDS